MQLPEFRQHKHARVSISETTDLLEQPDDDSKQLYGFEIKHGPIDKRKIDIWVQDLIDERFPDRTVLNRNVTKITSSVHYSDWKITLTVETEDNQNTDTDTDFK